MPLKTRSYISYCELYYVVSLCIISAEANTFWSVCFFSSASRSDMFSNPALDKASKQHTIIEVFGIISGDKQMTLYYESHYSIQHFAL